MYKQPTSSVSGSKKQHKIHDMRQRKRHDLNHSYFLPYQWETIYDKFHFCSINRSILFLMGN